MCGTTDSSFQSSNTLNNTDVWSLIELASRYTVPLSAVNGLSRLTTTSNGQARPIRKFSNRIGTADLNSNRISKLRRSVAVTLITTVIVVIMQSYIESTKQQTYTMWSNKVGAHCQAGNNQYWASDAN